MITTKLSIQDLDVVSKNHLASESSKIGARLRLKKPRIFFRKYSRVVFRVEDTEQKSSEKVPSGAKTIVAKKIQNRKTLLKN